MNIIINGRKKVSEELKRSLERVFDEVIKLLKEPKNLEVSLSFVGPECIKDLNKKNRKVDKVTDVLSSLFVILFINFICLFSPLYHL